MEVFDKMSEEIAKNLDTAKTTADVVRAGTGSHLSDPIAQRDHIIEVLLNLLRRARGRN